MTLSRNGISTTDPARRRVRIITSAVPRFCLIHLALCVQFLIDWALSNLNCAERQPIMKARSIVALLSLCLFSIYTFEVSAQTRRRAPRSPCAAITTPSGLTYLITKKGTGPQLKAGDTVVINYTGTLTNGTTFDSSYERNQPLEFKLGTGRVIKGWDEGVAKLRVGDQAILVIPGKLAYGPNGVPNVIPPDATLIFIIEVVSVKATSLTEVLSKPLSEKGLDVREEFTQRHKGRHKGTNRLRAFV